MDINEVIRKEAHRRRLSPRTIWLYQKCCRRFLTWSGKTIDKISKKDVRAYLNWLSDKNKAGNTINVYHMAIRFLMEECLNKKMKLNIRYAKTPKRLPVSLTKEELKRLFSSIKNDKHRLIFETIYSAGLRVSELINLKAEHIEFDKSYGFVRKGKGNKDRIFILSPVIRDKILKLIKKENISNNEIIFKSNLKKKFSARNLQKIIKIARINANIEKHVVCHSLRHTFATHLIENGSDLSQVQGLLGHKSPETSMMYIHMASPNMVQIKSPIDSL